MSTEIVYVCDNCGSRSKPIPNYYDRPKGWIELDRKNICPPCQVVNGIKKSSDRRWWKFTKP